MAETSGYSKPSEYASNDEKLSPVYAKSYAEYMYSQNSRNENYIDTQYNLLENELYRQGNQTNDNVKKYLLNGRDKSYGKLNFEPINVIPKYTKVAKKNLNIQLFNPKVKAIDSTSIEQRKKKRNELVDAMINQRFSDRQSQVTGIDFTPKGFIPSSDDDIDVFMETESTLPQQAAMEQALSAVREANNFSEIKERLADDVMSYGKLVVKEDYDPQLGVVVKRISPPNYGSSFDGSEMNDNRNSFYDYHIEMVSLVDIHGTYGIDEQKAFKWYTGYSSTEQEYIQKDSNKRKWDDISSTMVKCLFFEFRTTLTESYRKKTRKRGKVSVDRVEGFDFNKGNVVTLKKTKEVWMEGMWIIDSPFIFNYGIRKNMIKDSLKKVRSSYSSYDTNEMPFVRKLIPFSDKMNLAMVKIDQMVQAAIPKGISINLSSLLDVPNPDGGGEMSYLQLIRMYRETGDMVYRLDEFSAGTSLPIAELENGLSNDIGKYIDIYNHNLQQINIITGINPTMVGQGAPDRVSTESNQIALQSSIRSIEFIKDALLSVEKRLSENIVLRIQDIDKYDKPFKKYVQALGVYNMEALNALDSLHPYTFSLYIEMLPDNEERQKLNEDLTLSFQKGEIDVTDKMDIQNISNLKWAATLLKRRIAENKNRLQQEQLQLAQANQQAQLAETERKNQEKQIEYQFDSQLSRQKFEQDRELLAMELGIKNQEAVEQENFKLEKEARDKQSSNDKVVFQASEKRDLQANQFEFLENQSDKNGGESQKEKNLKKPLKQ